ncbi:HAMP domain-containing histidine kinase [Microbispora sp. RL4-1S]|uniref:histidine kinase n=1 Tax=Microbispora oryzae TaxID=2806554 RepID=A0A940WPH5_9ACTN|nr:HAMP domain-containing sensor histidine kinase [Microbispora oryzae]MBP2707182.1 HAMP domain-containing histidine kinase [Microbispora oryzae]
MTRWSVRLRATAVATAAVAVALAAVAAVLVVTLRSSLEASAAEEAARRADSTAQTLSVSTEPGSASVPGGEGGVSVGGGVGVGADPDVRVGVGPGPVALQGWSDGYVTATRTVATEKGPLVVQARTSMGPARDALNALLPLLSVGVPAVLLLVAGLTWLLVGRALAPVSAIRTKFAEITASDLHRRVPVPAARDEVARLARTMNATLDRLERAVERHRRFVADAAHELRSPLATLRTRLELGRRESPELTREALTDVARIQALAADLLLLARLDAGEPMPGEPVDLGQVAAEEALRPRRADVTVVVDAAPDVVVPGSRAHLGRMVANLVDNAVRHAATTVTVRVTTPAIIEVADDGPGIPPDQRESVFDRFTRLDEARARDAGGSGLGLAIARDIAQAHGGTLVVAHPDTMPAFGAAPLTGAVLRADLHGRASGALADAARPARHSES